MTPPATTAFSVGMVDYQAALADLRAVREPVFVHEQGVPLALEWDELDPASRHVLARDDAGNPVGTARLTPEHKIGRMAVLPEWRGRGVGDAMLVTLMDEARRLEWRRLSLHAQASAIGFYTRHGFLPEGERFVEAGIDHQSMQLLLGMPNPVETRAAALSALLAVLQQSRRHFLLYSRALDPELIDSPEVMAAFRTFATRGGESRILLHDPEAPQRAHAPLLGLAQRLPSAFAFRAIEEPADRIYASAYAVNDGGGYYFRPLGNRFAGETRLDAAGRARQLRASFEPVWERARPCTEYRVLGI